MEKPLLVLLSALITHVAWSGKETATTTPPERTVRETHPVTVDSPTST